MVMRMSIPLFNIKTGKKEQHALRDILNDQTSDCCSRLFCDFKIKLPTFVLSLLSPIAPALAPSHNCSKGDS